MLSWVQGQLEEKPRLVQVRSYPVEKVSGATNISNVGWTPWYLISRRGFSVSNPTPKTVTENARHLWILYAKGSKSSW